MTITRSGARLRNYSRVIQRGIAQMTADDYEQPKCEYCHFPIHDDRLEAGKPARFCSRKCDHYQSRKLRGLPVGQGYNTRWRPFYDQAINADGTWVTVHCESVREAESFCRSVSNKKGFMASRNGVSVSIRTVAA
jgi:hypothetical protein